MRQIPVVLLCLAQALVAIGPSAAEPLSLNEAEQAWIAAGDEVPVAVLSDWTAIDFVGTQGQHRGIAADYLRLIADRSGLRFSVVTEASFDDLLAKCMSGKLKVGSSDEISRDFDGWAKLVHAHDLAAATVALERHISGAAEMEEARYPMRVLPS